MVLFIGLGCGIFRGKNYDLGLAVIRRVVVIKLMDTDEWTLLFRGKKYEV